MNEIRNERNLIEIFDKEIFKIINKKNIRKNILVESLTKKILGIYEYIKVI